MSKKPGKFINIKGGLTSVDSNFMFDTNVKCKLNLEILHDIEVNFLTTRVCVEVRGILNYSPTVIYAKKLSGGASWMAGDILEYEFEFCPKDRISFYGEHVQFAWYVETDVDLTNASKNYVRKLYLKDFSLIKAFSPEKEYDRKLRFKVFPKKYIYFISDFNKHIKINTYRVTFLIPIILILLGIITGKILFYVFAFVAIVVLWYLKQRVWVFQQFKSLNISSKSIENNRQEVEVKFAQNWNKIESLDCYYEVREWVQDRRGTSTMTYDKLIKRTKYKRVKDVQKANIINTRINLEGVPGSFKQEDVEIQWYLILRANFKSGKTGLYKHKINAALNPYDSVIQ